MFYCHDCEFAANSLNNARKHSKESGPVFRKGSAWRHVLTRSEDAAKADRELPASDRLYQ